MGLSLEELKRAGIVVTGDTAHKGTVHEQADLFGNQGVSDTGVQEREDADCQRQGGQTVAKAASDHPTGFAKGDGQDGGLYRITVALRFCDKRRRDMDGCLCTILDCIMRARRRLLGTSAGDSPESGTVQTRRRRRVNNNREAVKGPVPF
jgi:hypothetical protein